MERVPQGEDGEWKVPGIMPITADTQGGNGPATTNASMEAQATGRAQSEAGTRSDRTGPWKACAERR